MFVVDNYILAVILCIVTMICWGSWGNTQKVVGSYWRQEYFYWDYVVGVVALSLILAFTLGSFGTQGRPFVEDMQQISLQNYLNAFIGGALMNTGNILLTISVSLVGLAVAFPVGVGLGLVFGVIINYFENPKGDPYLLFTGVALIVVSIVMSSLSSGLMAKLRDKESNRSDKQDAAKVRLGLIMAVLAGVFISFFYRFVAAAMDLENFVSPAAGKATPYSALFIFACGMFGCSLILNSYLMKKPFVGPPAKYGEYFAGKTKTHLIGVGGGLVWGLGSGLSYIAAGKAGPAVSYALGQGATIVAALWGLLVWQEFRGASKTIQVLLAIMIVSFLTGIATIIVSGGN